MTEHFDLTPLPTSLVENGWIAHDGRRLPVAPFLMVEVLTRGSLYHKGPAATFYWEEDLGGIHTVRKYRLLKEEK
jgi:hypothetical protein